jgi:hypothetical protein
VLALFTPTVCRVAKERKELGGREIIVAKIITVKIEK